MKEMTKLELGLGLAVLVLLCWIGWDQYHKALNEAVAEQTAQIKRQAQQQVDDALKQRDQEYKQDVANLQAKFDALRKLTPAQIVERAPQYVPVPKPIVIAGPETTSVPVGSAIVPPEDVEPLAKVVLDGQRCHLDLNKCQGDLTSWQQKYDLKDQEAQSWEKAAKGGSWAKRLGNNMLKIGAGVAIGYVLHR